MTSDSQSESGGVVSSTALFDILRETTYWTAGIFHSWQEGHGARAFRNSSIKTVAGKFKSESEAMAAAEKAIKARMIYGVRQWDSAQPVASFHIPHETNKKLGSIMDAMMSNDSSSATAGKAGVERKETER